MEFIFKKTIASTLACIIPFTSITFAFAPSLRAEEVRQQILKEYGVDIQNPDKFVSDSDAAPIEYGVKTDSERAEMATIIDGNFRDQVKFYGEGKRNPEDFSYYGEPLSKDSFNDIYRDNWQNSEDYVQTARGATHGGTSLGDDGSFKFDNLQYGERIKGKDGKYTDENGKSLGYKKAYTDFDMSFDKFTKKYENNTGSTFNINELKENSTKENALLRQNKERKAKLYAEMKARQDNPGKYEHVPYSLDAATYEVMYGTERLPDSKMSLDDPLFDVTKKVMRNYAEQKAKYDKGHGGLSFSDCSLNEMMENSIGTEKTERVNHACVQDVINRYKFPDCFYKRKVALNTVDVNVDLKLVDEGKNVGGYFKKIGTGEHSESEMYHEDGANHVRHKIVPHDIIGTGYKRFIGKRNFTGWLVNDEGQPEEVTNKIVDTNTISNVFAFDFVNFKIINLSNTRRFLSDAVGDNRFNLRKDADKETTAILNQLDFPTNFCAAVYDTDNGTKVLDKEKTAVNINESNLIIENAMLTLKDNNPQFDFKVVKMPTCSEVGLVKITKNVKDVLDKLSSRVSQPKEICTTRWYRKTCKPNPDYKPNANYLSDSITQKTEGDNSYVEEFKKRDPYKQNLLENIPGQDIRDSLDSGFYRYWQTPMTVPVLPSGNLELSVPYSMIGIDPVLIVAPKNSAFGCTFHCWKWDGTWDMRKRPNPNYDKYRIDYLQDPIFAKYTLANAFKLETGSYDMNVPLQYQSKLLLNQMVETTNAIFGDNLKLNIKIKGSNIATDEFSPADCYDTAKQILEKGRCTGTVDWTMPKEVGTKSKDAFQFMGGLEFSGKTSFKQLGCINMGGGGGEKHDYTKYKCSTEGTTTVHYKPMDFKLDFKNKAILKKDGSFLQSLNDLPENLCVYSAGYEKDERIIKDFIKNLKIADRSFSFFDQRGIDRSNALKVNYVEPAKPTKKDGDGDNLCNTPFDITVTLPDAKHTSVMSYTSRNHNYPSKNRYYNERGHGGYRDFINSMPTEFRLDSSYRYSCFMIDAVEICEYDSLFNQLKPHANPAIPKQAEMVMVKGAECAPLDYYEQAKNNNKSAELTKKEIRVDTKFYNYHVSVDDAKSGVLRLDLADRYKLVDKGTVTKLIGRTSGRVLGTITHPLNYKPATFSGNKLYGHVYTAIGHKLPVKELYDNKPAFSNDDPDFDLIIDYKEPLELDTVVTGGNMIGNLKSLNQGILQIQYDIHSVRTDGKPRYDGSYPLYMPFDFADKEGHDLFVPRALVKSSVYFIDFKNQALLDENNRAIATINGLPAGFCKPIKSIEFDKNKNPYETFVNADVEYNTAIKDFIKNLRVTKFVDGKEVPATARIDFLDNADNFKGNSCNDTYAVIVDNTSQDANDINFSLVSHMSLDCTSGDCLVPIVKKNSGKLVQRPFVDTCTQYETMIAPSCVGADANGEKVITTTESTETKNDGKTTVNTKNTIKAKNKCVPGEDKYCALASAVCVKYDSMGGCSKFNKNFSCQDKPKEYFVQSKKDTCNAEVHCVSGDCVPIKKEDPDDYAKVAAVLHMAQQVALDADCNTDENGALKKGEKFECKLFGGEMERCDKRWGKNCCHVKTPGEGNISVMDLVTVAPKLLEGASMIAESTGLTSSVSSFMTPIGDAVSSVVSDVAKKIMDKIMNSVLKKIYDKIKEFVMKMLGEMAERLGIKAGVATAAGAIKEGVESAVKAVSEAITNFMATETGVMLANALSVIGWLYTAYQVANLLLMKAQRCSMGEYKVSTKIRRGVCQYGTKYSNPPSRCVKKILGHCVRYRWEFCCQKSPLSRIIMEQVPLLSGNTNSSAFKNKEAYDKLDASTAPADVEAIAEKIKFLDNPKAVLMSKKPVEPQDITAAERKERDRIAKIQEGCQLFMSKPELTPNDKREEKGAECEKFYASEDVNKLAILNKKESQYASKLAQYKKDKANWDKTLAELEADSKAQECEEVIGKNGKKEQKCFGGEGMGYNSNNNKDFIPESGAEKRSNAIWAILEDRGIFIPPSPGQKLDSCKGLTIDEFTSLDLEKLNLDEWVQIISSDAGSKFKDYATKKYEIDDILGKGSRFDIDGGLDEIRGELNGETAPQARGSYVEGLQKRVETRATEAAAEAVKVEYLIDDGSGQQNGLNQKK